MKRKLITLVLSAAVIVSLVLISCAPAATPPPEEEAPPPEEEEEAPPPAPAEYEWTVFNWVKNDYWPIQWETRIIPDIETITNGRLKIDMLYPGEHPYKTPDLLGAVSERVCDVAMVGYVYSSGTEPRLAVGDLPFLQPGGHETKKEMHSMILPYYQQVLDEWNCSEMVCSFSGAQQLWLVEGWVEDFDSLRGKRIRTFNAEIDDTVKLMNGIPIRIDPAEVYMSLQTKLIDGLITGATYSYMSKFPEVCKHYQPLNLFQVTVPTIVNDDAWNELPKDMQSALMAYYDEISGWYPDGPAMQDGMLLSKAVTEFGLEIRPVPADFRAELVARAYEGVWKPWLDRVGEEGVEALDKVIGLLEEAGYTVKGY